MIQTDIWMISFQTINITNTRIILMFLFVYFHSKGGRLLTGDAYGYRKGKNHYKQDIGPTILRYIECPWDSVKLVQCSERSYAYKDYILSCEMHVLDVELECNSEPFPGNCLKRIENHNTCVRESIYLHVNDGMWHIAYR